METLPSLFASTTMRQTYLRWTTVKARQDVIGVEQQAAADTHESC